MSLMKRNALSTALVGLVLAYLFLAPQVRIFFFDQSLPTGTWTAEVSIGWFFYLMLLLVPETMGIIWLMHKFEKMGNWVYWVTGAMYLSLVIPVSVHYLWTGWDEANILLVPLLFPVTLSIFLAGGVFRLKEWTSQSC